MEEYKKQLRENPLFHIKKEDGAFLKESKGQTGNFYIAAIEFSNGEKFDCRICGVCKENGVYAIKIYYHESGLAHVGLFIVNEDKSVEELPCSIEQRRELNNYASTISDGNVSFFVLGTKDVAVLLAYNIQESEYKAYAFKLPREYAGRKLNEDLFNQDID